MTHDGVEVLVPKDNYTEWMAREVGEYAFMCEKGRDILDYLGCYNATGLVWDYNTTEFDQMTIQQCVEWCRSGSRIYAFVSSSLCACSDTLTQHAAAGAYCYNRCSGQQNQVCGGEGLMSVYNICKQIITFPSNQLYKFIVIRLYHMSPVTRKPVFGIFDQVRLKPAC